MNAAVDPPALHAYMLVFIVPVPVPAHARARARAQVVKALLDV